VTETAPEIQSTLDMLHDLSRMAKKAHYPTRTSAISFFVITPCSI
jgi:hypothetical protein